jgi:hypothetical protein
MIGDKKMAVYKTKKLKTGINSIARIVFLVSSKKAKTALEQCYFTLPTGNGRVTPQVAGTYDSEGVRVSKAQHWDYLSSTLELAGIGRNSKTRDTINDSYDSKKDVYTFDLTKERFGDHRPSTVAKAVVQPEAVVDPYVRVFGLEPSVGVTLPKQLDCFSAGVASKVTDTARIDTVSLINAIQSNIGNGMTVSFTDPHTNIPFTISKK